MVVMAKYMATVAKESSEVDRGVVWSVATIS